MEVGLLLQWLKLPAGGWPPDDRALLGLPLGPVDADAAEQNALARMEVLRPHQLRHPELVTEGMNRLAQALIALTATSTAAPTPNAPAEFDYSPDRPPPPLPLPSEPLDAEAVDDDEVVEAEVVQLPAPPKVQPIPLPDDAPIIPLEDATAPPPGATFTRTDRRKVYRELALLRRLKHAWEELGPVAGVPSDGVRTAEAVYRVLVARRELLALFDTRPELNDVFEEAGRAVVAVVLQPHPAAVLRELVPSQRAGVAADWAAGRVRVYARLATLRRHLRAGRPSRWGVRLAERVGGFFRSNPEWILVAATGLLLAAGVARAMMR